MVVRAALAAAVLCTGHTAAIAHEPVEEIDADGGGDKPVSLSAEFKLVSDYRDRACPIRPAARRRRRW